ncbi:MAG: methionine--tRNA ligase subunit beta [Nanoarchaeota archaeon]
MKEQIDFNEFLEIEKKLEIRYGTIVEVEKMEKSDKMLKLLVDFGTEKRTVMTNIGNRLDRTSFLVGIQFPFIMNLKPANIMGVESSAMIMICEDEEGKIQWPAIGFKNGSKLL